MLVVDLHTDQYSDVDEREAFAMQLRGTHHVVHISAKWSYRYALSFAWRKPFPPGEPAIATNAEYAFKYAKHVLRKPFPLGEAAIATDAEYSQHYAVRVLCGPFPLGEHTIATSPHYSYLYARYALHGPFPLGEHTISTHGTYAYLYSQQVLRVNKITQQYKNRF